MPRSGLLLPRRWGLEPQGDRVLFCSRVLLQAGYDPNVQDKDGWAPLHAAAHWGVEEACRLLAEHFCDMESLNNVVRRGKGRGKRNGHSMVGGRY